MQLPHSRRAPLGVVAFAIVFAAGIRTASGQQQLPADSARSPAPAPAPGTDSSPLNDLRRELADLRAEVVRLESAKPAASPTTAGPTVSVGADGFSLKSADKAFEIRVRGYFQTDGRVRVGSNSSQLTSTLLLRRMRPILDVTMWRLMDFHLMPDFADGRLYDANFDLRLSKPFALRAGKFKPPVSLERLQSAADIEFVERGLPTNLAPSRDIGVQAFGEIAGGVMTYSAGVFNGVPDLAVGDADNGPEKDFVGRVLVAPWKVGGILALRGLTVGVAGSRGIQRGTVTAPFLAGYRAPSQQVVLAYRSNATVDGTTIANGMHTRLYPQGTFYLGPFGALGEYARSSQMVRRGTSQATLTNKAWQLLGTFVVTGENASYKGVVPAKAFDPSAHHWGAFELVARVGGLSIDPETFPVFADPLTQVKREASWGAGVNWYLARSIRLLLDLDVTSFRGGSAKGNRPSERVLLTRIQHGF